MKSREVFAGVTLGMVFAAGCSSIQENDSIGSCSDSEATPIVATFQGDEDYDRATDPVELAAVERERAEEVQDQDSRGWDVHMRNQIVGLGEMVCKAEDGTHYLTAEGAEISNSL